MSQELYDKLNESWVEYMEDVRNDILTAAHEYQLEQSYEQDEKQTAENFN